MERRRLEREARVDAIPLVRLCRLRALTWERTAALLRVSAETLRRWLREWREDRLAIEPRGRPVERPRTEVRNQVLGAIGLVGPGAPVSVLRRLFPSIARRELEDLVARFRRVYRRRGTLLHQLTWSNDGSVWAMDFTQAPTPIDAAYPHVLVVRDLGSGRQLLALPCEGQTAEVVCDALRALFLEHGAPLVLKSDNGSAFVAEITQQLLAQHEVLALLSPPGTPEYNGACEAGIGGLKTRAHHVAARHGRPGEWTCDDVEAARVMANETARPNGSLGPTPDDLWASRLPRGDRALLHATATSMTKEERDHFRNDVGRDPDPEDEPALARQEWERIRREQPPQTGSVVASAGVRSSSKNTVVGLRRIGMSMSFPATRLIEAIRARIGDPTAPSAIEQDVKPPASPEAIRQAEARMGCALHPLQRRVLTEIGDGGFGPGFGLLGVQHGVDGRGCTLVEVRDEVLDEQQKRAPVVPLCEWGDAIWSFVDVSTGHVITVREGEMTDTCRGVDEWLAAWSRGEDLFGQMFELIEITAVSPFTRKPMVVRNPGRAIGIPYGVPR